ncbi:MAG: M48 family metalloprotease [Candidatus Aminicenantes bacterium]|nr:M48 family metalloprotease [Candidatus Aminicenantes bacterium]
MRGYRFWLWASVLTLVVFCLSDCAAIENQIESMTRVEVSESDKQAIVKTTKALRDSFSDITEEEEYYIGRSVSAMILARYPANQNQALNTYVNKVGNAVAVFSDRPEIYAGYHFIVLNTDEVNALAAPGGFIFITKGLLKRCRDEEMLGCILAHEVGHVSAKHGLRSIKKSRLVDAFKIMGQEATRKYGPQELAQLTSVFEDVLGDIAEKLIENGYDRKYEYEADKLGARVGALTGYNPHGLVDFLQTMVDEPGALDKGWFKTHPSAQDRIKRVQKEIGKLKGKPVTQKVRTSRFQQAVKGLN